MVNPALQSRFVGSAEILGAEVKQLSVTRHVAKDTSRAVRFWRSTAISVLSLFIPVPPLLHPLNLPHTPRILHVRSVTESRSGIPVLVNPSLPLHSVRGTHTD